MISLADAVEAFLRGREVSGATQATLRTYAFTLDRFSRASGVQMLSEVTPKIIESHLGDLRARMKPISATRNTPAFIGLFTRDKTGRRRESPALGRGLQTTP